MKSIALLIFAAPLFAASPTVEIKVDQVGYLPTAAKIAMVVSKNPATEFTLNLSKDGKAMLHGTLSAPRDDFDSGDPVRTADFSKWIKPGQYYMEVPGVGRSWDFDIAPERLRQDVAPRHALLLRPALRHRRRFGSRIPRLQARRLSPGRRLARLLRQDRPAALPRAVGTMPAITAATWSTPASPPARCSGPGRCSARA